jgi:hypothetical protein
LGETGWSGHKPGLDGGAKSRESIDHPRTISGKCRAPLLFSRSGLIVGDSIGEMQIFIFISAG